MTRATNKLIPVSLAILQQNGKFLMQLRDELPNIVYPGCWGLFGGHVELGETPETALKRELIEEINYFVTNPIKFGCYADNKVIRHVYYAPLTVSIAELTLNEGWDLALVTAQEIILGSCYSAQAKQNKFLGAIHQQILLDFLEKNPLKS